VALAGTPKDVLLDREDDDIEPKLRVWTKSPEAEVGELDK
jgi:hypothetical protein